MSSEDSEDYQEFNIAKSKVFFFQNYRKLAGFTLQARYLVKHFFIIISTCCAHHVVYFTLVMDLWLAW